MSLENQAEADALDYDEAGLKEEGESLQATEVSNSSTRQEDETIGAEAWTTIECRRVRWRGSIFEFLAFTGS